MGRRGGSIQQNNCKLRTENMLIYLIFNYSGGQINVIKGLVSMVLVHATFDRL